MREWILVYTTEQEALDNGYTKWETDYMQSWYTKEALPTLLPITGGLGYIRQGKKAELIQDPGSRI